MAASLNSPANMKRPLKCVPSHAAELSLACQRQACRQMSYPPLVQMTPCYLTVSFVSFLIFPSSSSIFDPLGVFHLTQEVREGPSLVWGGAAPAALLHGPLFHPDSPCQLRLLFRSGKYPLVLQENTCLRRWFELSG